MLIARTTQGNKRDLRPIATSKEPTPARKLFQPRGSYGTRQVTYVAPDFNGIQRI